MLSAHAPLFCPVCYCSPSQPIVHIHMEPSELLKKVRKIEIKARGLSSHLFTGGYHSAFKRPSPEPADPIGGMLPA